MDLSGLPAINTPEELIAWLSNNCLTPIRPVMSGTDIGVIFQKVIMVLESSTGAAGSILDAIASAPVLANEAAAIEAELAPFTLYKTASGALRYKLPTNENNQVFTFTLPLILS